MSLMSTSRPARLAMVAFAALALSVAPALAQAGKGRSMGSRGSQTYSAPPATQTAPRQAQPMERSVTQPQQAQPGAAQARPGQQPAAAPSFGKALMGGLLGGFLGAGLFSLLSGGGLGGMGGFLMMLVQIALVAGLAFLVISFFRRRSQQPAMATAGMPDQAPLQRDMQEMNGGSGVGHAGGFGAAAGRPLSIGPDDYNTFERLLGEVQAAYSREDIGALRLITTPEMAVYLDEGLSETAAQGKVDRFGKPELLQGDLAEAWSEGEDDYATVAMRFAMPVATLERASQKPISGDLSKPREFTEIWTFRRNRGDAWKLSAIQQTM